MSEMDPDAPPKPIVVPPSPVSDQVTTLMRDVLIILSVLPGLIAVLGTKDIIQVAIYVGSTEFAPALGLILTVAVLVWRQWLARRSHAKEVTMAEATPDSVAFVAEKK